MRSCTVMLPHTTHFPPARGRSFLPGSLNSTPHRYMLLLPLPTYHTARYHTTTPLVARAPLLAPAVDGSLIAGLLRTCSLPSHAPAHALPAHGRGYRACAMHTHAPPPPGAYCYTPPADVSVTASLNLSTTLRGWLPRHHLPAQHRTPHTTSRADHTACTARFLPRYCTAPACCHLPLIHHLRYYPQLRATLLLRWTAPRTHTRTTPPPLSVDFATPAFTTHTAIPDLRLDGLLPHVPACARAPRDGYALADGTGWTDPFTTHRTPHRRLVLPASRLWMDRFYFTTTFPPGSLLLTRTRCYTTLTWTCCG